MDYVIYTLQWAYKNNSDDKAIWRDVEEITASRLKSMDSLLQYLLKYTVDIYQDTNKIKFRMVSRDIYETVVI